MLQGLLHEPCGLEHPYEQELTERFPHDPEEDQPVGIGVSTWPAGSAQKVWAAWHIINETEVVCAEGEWRKDESNRSYWSIRLPAFKRGQKINYRVHARSGDRQLSSRTFSFTVAG